MAAAPETSSAPPVLTSRDIVAGLGFASRDLLAACLALFDDSTLQRRMGTLIERWTSDKGKTADAPADAETVAAVQQSLLGWKSSPLSDDGLRVVLWIYLREAFGLPANTFASLRSAGTAADDVVARALHSLQPGRVAKFAQGLGLKDAKELPATLDALARKTMEELMASFLDADDARTVEARERLLSEARARIGELPPEDRQRLMQAVGADDLNDAALRNILLTGGGLGAFGMSVSLAGFSAYILAAQASAFIPFISGPALVSMVAVLSNPITIIAATAGMGWWAAHSVNQKVRGAVGVRVLSLLALNGLEAGSAGQRAMLHAFAELDGLRGVGGLAANALGRYQADWVVVSRGRCKAVVLDTGVAELMERPAGASHDRLGKLVDGDSDAWRDTAVLAGLTLGDVLYNAFSLEPEVLKAADFSQAADLSNAVAFSKFAHRIEQMNPGAELGAISSLKGYVAERVVAAQLIAQGHVVEFPDASNEPGWDILVDGEKFQVKDMANLSGLQHHFDRFDYPVIANSEIAEKLARYSDGEMPDWAGNVHFVEGYSNEVVEQVSRSSIDAGDGMLHPHVPLFTVVLSSVRNITRVNRDEITGTQAVQEVLLDGGTRAGLAVAGNYVGVGVGLLVFGPAGALVLGSVVPVLSQRQSNRLKGKLDEWVQDETYCTWAVEARDALSRLIARADEELRKRASLLQDRMPAESQAVTVCYLQWRLDDELCFLCEARCRLESIRDDKEATIESLVARTMSWLSTSTLHPVTYQVELAVLSAAFKRRPSTADRVSEVAKRTTEKAMKTAGEIGSEIGKWWRGRGSNNKQQRD